MNSARPAPASPNRNAAYSTSGTGVNSRITCAIGCAGIGSNNTVLTSVTAPVSTTASTARVHRTTSREWVANASVSAPWLANATGTMVRYASGYDSTEISHAAQAFAGLAKPLGFVGSIGAAIWNSAAE